MSIETLMEQEMAAYSTPGERAAYRAGMSTAAAICDAVCKEVIASNTTRGRLTTAGGAMSDVATECGDRITAARERVPVEQS